MRSSPSAATMTHDTLGLFNSSPISWEHRSIASNLTKARNGRRATAPHLERDPTNRSQEAVVSRTNPHNSVTRAGMETLAAGRWINDKIMDYVVKTLIAPGERSIRA